MLFEGVAVWAGLPAALFALLMIAGFGIRTRFTWILLLLGIAGLAAEGLALGCAGRAHGARLLSVAWGLAAVAVMIVCAAAIRRLLRGSVRR